MPFSWRFEQLPFIWAPLEQPTGGPLPDRLPFTLAIDETTGRLMQVPDDAVEAALEKAYAEGSMIAGRMDEKGLGREYADDFLAFIGKACGDVAGSRILEIGSGTGYLLSRLAQAGADTTGVEPGDHGQHRFEGPGVTLVRDFFPSEQVTGEFDIIAMFCVLEHVASLGEWLDTVGAHLAEGGKLLIAVPECEPFLEQGDLSILVHEHYSYFTERSLRDTLSGAGFGDLTVEQSGLGGSLYCAASGSPEKADPQIAQAVEEATAFRSKAEHAINRLNEFLTQTRDNGESVAIYVPLRAANFIALSGAPTSHCRFFDDDPLQQGHYLPGFDVVLEGGDALVSSPTDVVLIMSRAFGAKIKARLEPDLPPQTRFVSVDELLST